MNPAIEKRHWVMLALQGWYSSLAEAIPSSKLRQSVSAISVFASMRTKGFRSAVATRLCCMVAVCSCLASWHQNFLTVPGKDIQRRALAAALASQVLVPSAPAIAGDRDRTSMLIAVRRKWLPRILQNYKKLQADGTVTDEFISGKDFKKFIVALDSYGSIQRLDEAPDKYSRKLQADAKEVEKLLKGKEYQKSLEMLEVFRQDIPAGPGSFVWTDEG
ncbi:unnamed protein product [Symbiodinium necroappetens]|uniref:Uncharacterized protein n=1 Tax=Symbiodinium necroappetens TaxID=1628268 RepID=A0A812SLD0_9DINO|nr:unnamed protein product [Symbiodinium necroappetens]